MHSKIQQQTACFRVLALILLIFGLLAGCGNKQPSSRFELDLKSSVFGDIIIEQGGSNHSQLVIDRSITKKPFAEAIELSLIDPPEWLSYRFENNPAAANEEILTMNASSNAQPGIYRMQLLGVGTRGEHTVSDSFTFHIKIAAPASDEKISLFSQWVSWAN